MGIARGVVQLCLLLGIVVCIFSSRLSVFCRPAVCFPPSYCLPSVSFVSGAAVLVGAYRCPSSATPPPAGVFNVVIYEDGVVRSVPFFPFSSRLQCSPSIPASSSSVCHRPFLHYSSIWFFPFWVLRLLVSSLVSCWLFRVCVVFLFPMASSELCAYFLS